MSSLTGKGRIYIHKYILKIHRYIHRYKDTYIDTHIHIHIQNIEGDDHIRSYIKHVMYKIFKTYKLFSRQRKRERETSWNTVGSIDPSIVVYKSWRGVRKLVRQFLTILV